MRTLVAWCPDWPVTAAGFGPEDPAAVLSRGRVVAASVAARARRVQIGLSRRESESRCPGLVVHTRDPTQEARAFEPIMAALATLTPRIEVIRPGLLALDARGPTRYFGGEALLRERVAVLAHQAMATEKAWPPGVGVADGRFAARLAARQGVIVPAGENRSFLAPFPLDVLERPELVELLGRLGIRTLGAFADLPASAVLARFGTSASRSHALAQGISQDLLHVKAPPEDLVVATDFDPPVDRAETVAFLARSLASDLTAQLDRRGLACGRLRIEAETEHGEVLTRLWRGDDQLGPDAMVERLRWQLDGWLSGTTTETIPTAGIIRLALVADEVVPVGDRQFGLWGGASDVDHRARRGLDRVQGMLGSEAVFTAVLNGGRSPADRVTLVPWGEPRPSQSPTLPWPGHHPLPAPALVHLALVRAEVTDVEGRAVVVSARGKPSGAPGQISMDGGPWRAVVDWAGPWTADERWWDPPSRRRQARFQVITEDHTAYLCLVEIGRWRIEATYD